MKAENIAQWVIDNRYSFILNSEMYSVVLRDIKSLLNKENSHEGQVKLCSNCKYLNNPEGEEPCKTCLNYTEYINHEWA